MTSTDIYTLSLHDALPILELQNRNPVKVLTSGRERRVAVPFEASGKLRYEERVPWWNDYADPEFCIFGHYGAPPGDRKSTRLNSSHVRISYAVFCLKKKKL